jgi:RNA recognition motif-containing protein
VYVKNLDERVKLDTLIETLRGVFAEYGTVLDVIAKKSLKRKGQAFIVYDSIDSAQNAIDELQGFDIFDKQMHLDFAKTRSDLTVLREDGQEGLESHKKHRLAEKERKQAIEAAALAKEQAAAKRPATGDLAERPAKTAKPAQAAGVVPDEYLPPNKILFLRDLPEDYGKDMLTTIFSRFTGFKEVRTVPGRTEIAFVEYESEEGAIQAKEGTNGMSLGDKAIRVTFQRQ